MRRIAFLILVLIAPAAFAESGPRPREVRLDRDGNFLPEGAISRLGSRLFRDPGAERLYVDDAGQIVSCFEGSAVRWWDLETGRFLRGWAGAGKQKVWFAADGRRAAWHAAGEVIVWDTWNDVRVKALTAGDDQKVLATAFSDDHRSVAAATLDATGRAYRLWIWDLGTGRGRAFGNSAEEPFSVSFADGGRILIARSDPFSLVGWDVRRLEIRWRVDWSGVFALDRTGRRFVSVDARDEKIGLYDAATAQPEAGVIQLPEDEHVHSLRELSPDGHTLHFGHRKLWDLFQTAAVTRKLSRDCLRNSDEAGAFTADGRQIVLRAAERLHVFDVASGRRQTCDLREWGHRRELKALYWSTDSRRVLTWTDNHDPENPGWEVFAWRPLTGRALGTADRDDIADARKVRAFAYWGNQFHDEPRGPAPRDSSGRRLGYMPGLTHTTDRALLACGRYEGEPLEPVPESERIIVCGRRRTLLRMESPTVVEACTGRPLCTLPIKSAGHIAFSPDSRSLAVIKPDGVHLYDVITGREQLVRNVPMYPHSDATMPCGLGLSFSPDGSRLAVIEHGGTVLVLDVALRRTRSPLADGELDRLWEDLSSPDPKVGWAAVFRLSEHPEDAVKALRTRLTPIREPDGVAAFIRKLDSDDFRTRESAYRRLQELGDAVRPSIAAALNNGADPESRQRLAALQAALADDQPPLAADLRRLRDVAVLERAGTKEALTVLKELADGLADTRLTRAAKEARERIRNAKQAQR